MMVTRRRSSTGIERRTRRPNASRPVKTNSTASGFARRDEGRRDVEGGKRTHHTEAQAGWPLTCSALPSALSRMYSFSSFPRNIWTTTETSQEAGREAKERESYHHCRDESGADLLNAAGGLSECGGSL